MKPNKKSENAAASPKLTKKDVVRAALNDSALSQTHFQLGDRTFPLKDLTYDQYNKFLLLVAPLVDIVIGRMGERAQAQQLGFSDLDISLFSVTDILKYCGEAIPELATICCQASDPTVTVETVKSLTNKPTVLAGIILKQIVHNNMIQDFADFFGQILPLTKK
jgi:hypothetical protein